MAEVKFAELPDRGVVEVAGADAKRFLTDLITSGPPAGGQAGYGALLTPQGKVQADFIVFNEGGRYLFDLRRDLAEGFVRRLGFYRLRAKVEIADRSASHAVVALWEADPPPAIPGAVVAADPRLAALGFRAIVARPAAGLLGEAADANSYHARRIALGVPEGGVDFAFGEAFPHDADLDQLGGVDFAKGCFVGQEVVSRMQHRGTARRRIVIAESAGHGLAPGAAIEAAGKPIGTLGSTSGSCGLALVRLDRAREAIEAGLPLIGGDIPVVLRIPAWARFGWPETVAEA